MAFIGTDAQAMERAITTPQDAVRLLIELVGEDPDRPGVTETPARVTKALLEMCAGYQQDPRKILEKVFPVNQNTLVVLSGINFYSMCEHHMLPFFGTATIAYMPNGSVVGLSKLPRLVDCFSKRMQVQERLTQQIADSVAEYIKPKPTGVGVMVTARHLCMCARGVKSESKTMSSCAVGSFCGNADIWRTIENQHEANR